MATLGARPNTAAQVAAMRAVADEAGRAPQCPLGYPRRQLEAILGDRFDEFARWARGETAAICDGRRYDHDKGEYEPTECAEAPHGLVVYPWDVERFLSGGRPLD